MADDSNSGDTSWLLTSSALVLLMTPALAIFYGGMVSARAVVHTMMLSFASIATISLFWSLCGYSLAFGPPIDDTGPDWLGDMHFGLFDSSNKLRPTTDVPEHAYFVFQMQFAIITAAVVSGAVCERISLWAWCLFSIAWCLVVYVPVARALFYNNGFLASWGALDFAGGVVVEQGSGVSAFVLAAWLDYWAKIESRRFHKLEHGRSRGASMSSLLQHGEEHGHQPLRPHNLPLVLLGCGLLYVGWMGFNAGSALSAGYNAARAFANTHLAAAAAMCMWAIAEVLWSGERLFRGHPTAAGTATGVVVGLVAITPACGYVGQMSSIAIGAIAAIACYWAVRSMKYVPVHDKLECLPCHGVAGMVGTLCVGLFANVNEDSPFNGAFYGNPELLGKQAAAVCVGLLFDIVGTSVAFLFVAAVGWIFGLHVRVPRDVDGNVDDNLYGESGYELMAGTHQTGAGAMPRNSVDDLVAFLGMSQSRARASMSSDVKMAAVRVGVVQ